MISHAFVSGAQATACLVAAMFFVRYWRQTRDRFFVYWAVAFAVLAANATVKGLHNSDDENAPELYVLRLVAFLVIVASIIDKNRVAKRPRSPTGQVDP